MNLWHRISYFHDAGFGKCCFRELRSAKKRKQHFLKCPRKKSDFRNTIHSLVRQPWHAPILIAALSYPTATVIVSSEKSYLEEKQISLAVGIVRTTVLWSFIESITERFKQKSKKMGFDWRMILNYLPTDWLGNSQYVTRIVWLCFFIEVSVYFFI